MSVNPDVSSISRTPTLDNKERTILAIDYGRQRIGLALSDELALTARPLTVLNRTNRRNTILSLRQIFRKYKVGLIIVGYPLHLSGAISEMANEAARFALRIKKELGVHVELVDERLTSWEAHQGSAVPGRRSRRDSTLDDVAAAIFLQEYLDHVKNPTVGAPRREAR